MQTLRILAILALLVSCGYITVPAQDDLDLGFPVVFSTSSSQLAIYSKSGVGADKLHLVNIFPARIELAGVVPALGTPLVLSNGRLFCLTSNFLGELDGYTWGPRALPGLSTIDGGRSITDGQVNFVLKQAVPSPSRIASNLLLLSTSGDPFIGQTYDLVEVKSNPGLIVRLETTKILTLSVEEGRGLQLIDKPLPTIAVLQSHGLANRPRRVLIVDLESKSTKAEFDLPLGESVVGSSGSSLYCMNKGKLVLRELMPAGTVVKEREVVADSQGLIRVAYQLPEGYLNLISSSGTMIQVSLASLETTATIQLSAGIGG